MTVIGVPAVGQAPGGPSLDALCDEIALSLKMPKEAEVLDLARIGIVDGIRRMNTRSWNSHVSSQDLTVATIAASSKPYEAQISPTYRAPLRMNLIDSDGKDRGVIEYRDPATFQDEGGVEVGVATCQPDTFTVFCSPVEAKVTFNVAISAAQSQTYPTIRLRYFERIAEPTQGGPVGVTSEEARFLFWHARAFVASIRDPSRYQSALAVAEQAWREIVSADITTEQFS